MKNSCLKDLKLYKEDDRYYLYAEYEKEDDDKITRTIIPKIELPVMHYPYIENYEGLCGIKCDIDLGFGSLTALRGDVSYPRNGKMCDVTNVFYVNYVKKIKTKTKKMTLSEIEKKLGHKIELVSEDQSRRKQPPL